MTNPSRDQRGLIEPMREVCALSDEALRERLAMIRTEIAPHLQRTVQLADGVRFEFARSRPMQEKLERLVALERECCTPIDFAVRVEPEMLRFEITGINVDSRAFAVLSQEASAAGRGGSGIARWLRATGLGSAAAFFFCCIVPLGLTALLGGAAAPLLGLDDPWIMAAAAIAFGAAFLVFDRRRAARRAERSVDAPPCAY